MYNFKLYSSFGLEDGVYMFFLFYFDIFLLYKHNIFAPIRVMPPNCVRSKMISMGLSLLPQYWSRLLSALGQKVRETDIGSDLVTY